MKKNLLLSVLIIMGFLVQAQQKIVFNKDDNHAVGDALPDTVVAIGTLIDSQIEFNCYISNLTDEIVETVFKREIVEYVSGAADQFCWGVCTMQDETTQERTLPLTGTFPIPANKDFHTHDDGGGVFHYIHKGNVGTTILKYTIYSVVDGTHTPEDTIVIKYTALPVGVNENIASSVNLSNPYPNPASTHTYVNYSFEKQMNAQIVVCNVIGKKIAVYQIDNLKGKIKVSTSVLPAGIYFINIESNGKLLTNQKFIKK